MADKIVELIRRFTPMSSQHGSRHSFQRGGEGGACDQSVAAERDDADVVMGVRVDLVHDETVAVERTFQVILLRLGPAVREKIFLSRSARQPPAG